MGMDECVRGRKGGGEGKGRIGGGRRRWNGREGRRGKREGKD